jgi:hypothetical protein
VIATAHLGQLAGLGCLLPAKCDLFRGVVHLIGIRGN